MSNKLFQQNLDDKKGPQPGGPYLIQMLFKEPVDMPDKEKMTAVMGKHIGSAECFCYDKKMAGFAALDHIAEFQDGKCPVQLMVMKCDKFKGKGFDAFLLSQMWDCQEDRERIFRECRYQGGGHRYVGCGASGAGAGQPGRRLLGGSGGAVPLMRSILFPELRQAVSGRGCALPSD